MIQCFDMIFIYFVFFFNDTATTEIYTLSLHDALPISAHALCRWRGFRELMQSNLIWTKKMFPLQRTQNPRRVREKQTDRKSTRLNSSHVRISYAVFCLKKKNQKIMESSYRIILTTKPK